MGVVLPFAYKRGTPRLVPMQSSVEMRRLVYRQCQNEACAHTWTQPSPTGACPQCHGEQVANIGEGVCAAPYRR